MARLATVSLACLVVGACHLASPGPGMAFRLAGEVESWSRDAATGRLESTICGVPLTVDLRGRDSRIVVTLDNATEAPLSLRMGPHATATPGALVPAGK